MMIVTMLMAMMLVMLIMATAIAGMIQHIGWVRKHLSAGKQAVRGVVLTGWTSDELVYAATALKDSVSFLGWRLSLGFESLAP